VVPNALDVTNLAFYLDLLPTQVPLYVKNSNGSLTLNSNGDSIVQLDSNGDPINVNCYKVAWVIDKTITNISIYAPGLLTQRNGISN
jgi:exosome complex RNA-binding protein Rrp42 (RNase PH superfamily)